MGSRWESEDSMNLLFSIILYPDMIAPEDVFLVSMALSLGIYDFLGKFVKNCSIKWPNDIFAGEGKIAGMLIENTIEGNAIISTVAGIGLNVNQREFPPFIPRPVSLKTLTGKDLDTDYCLKELITRLDRRYKMLISGETDEIRREYISSLYRLGQMRTYKTGPGVLYGRISSVTDSGYLLIEDEKSKVHQFSNKEVEFMP